MQRYFAELAYNGTNYHGWQIQPNAITVQEVIEESLAKVLREKVAVTGAGRTDTGVHASHFVLHFESEQIANFSVNGTLDQFVNRLNRILPFDIAFFRILLVPEHTHARFDAISRTYHYRISRFKSPFTQNEAYYFPFPLDVPKMQEAASVLKTYTDFTTFSKLHTQVKTNNCVLMQANWEEQGTELVLTIKADRFLRNMVRAIVGTLLDVGRGKMTIEQMQQAVEAKNRGKAGVSVPGHALYLNYIEYPAGVL